MEKIYTALGLMSGTSMDGVDASILSSSDGIQYEGEFNRYYEYDKDIYQKLSSLRDKIFTSKDLKKHLKEVKSLEKEITLFHAKVVNDVNNSVKIFLVLSLPEGSPILVVPPPINTIGL